MSTDSLKPLGQISRREKRAFLWTCIWCVMVILSYGAAVVFTRWALSEIHKAFSSAAPMEEPAGILKMLKPWRILGASLLLISGLGFLINLVRWLLAIRKRRQLEAALFPRP